MTDHDVEQRLRTWYRDEVSDMEAAPPALRAALADITLQPSRWIDSRRNIVLLAAAAMLLVAAIGSALAVGSGLIRLPWLDDRVLSNAELVPIFGSCEPTIPDGVLLQTGGGRQAAGEPYDDMPSYVLYQDGRLLGHGPGAGGWSGWSQRRMTPDGIDLLLSTIADLHIPSCEPIYLPEHPITAYDLTIAMDGAITQLHLGQGLFETGAATDTVHAAAVDLFARFATPDLALPDSAWIDNAWQPYPVERYVVLAQYFSAGSQPSSEGWDFMLPDGSTLRTFGEGEPGSLGAGLLISRCGVLDAAEAEEMMAALDASSLFPDFAPYRDDGKALQLGDGGWVYVNDALPHEVDCRSANGIPRTPAVSLDPAVANLAVCELLPDYAQSVSTAFRTEGGWTGCGYEQLSGDTPAYAYTYVHNRATSEDEALALARILFGQDGFASDRIAGRAVYLNECISSPIPCSPAIAISADPFFVVVEQNPNPGESGTEKRLRTLAAVVIDTLTH
jgi:hypothetical protein